MRPDRRNGGGRGLGASTKFPGGIQAFFRGPRRLRHPRSTDRRRAGTEAVCRLPKRSTPLPDIRRPGRESFRRPSRYPRARCRASLWSSPLCTPPRRPPATPACANRRRLWTAAKTISPRNRKAIFRPSAKIPCRSARGRNCRRGNGKAPVRRPLKLKRRAPSPRP